MSSYPNYRIYSSSHCSALVCCPTCEKFELWREKFYEEKIPLLCVFALFRRIFAPVETALRLYVTPSTSANSRTGNRTSVISLRERFPHIYFLDKDCAIPSRGLKLLPSAAFGLTAQHWICSSCFKSNALIPCENSYIEGTPTAANLNLLHLLDF